MTNKFTASEVRRTAAAIEGKQMLVSSMLRAYVDLLEADERAVPVAVVKDSDALYTGYLSWTGESVPPETKLYTHPAPADAERLAEALRNLVEASHYADAPDEHEAAEAALAAHSAKAQSPDDQFDPERNARPGDLDELRIERGGAVRHVAIKKPLFDSDTDPKRIQNVADGLRRQGEFESARMLDSYADLLEAQEKAVPVATVEDQFGFPIMEWIGDAGEKCPVGTNLYTHSAQAQPPAASMQDVMAVFEVVSGVEGPCLTISRKADGKPRHEYRLAGPKPWGGGNTTHSFKVHTRELREQIDAIETALAAQENPNG